MQDSDELSVLEHLVGLRIRLTALKKDRSDYIRARDVVGIYKQLCDQVRVLNQVRDGRDRTEETSMGESRVDTVLNDVFHLLSLFFLTIGKNEAAPATYGQLGAMRRLLVHLHESGIYTEADLQPYENRLEELGDIIENADKRSKENPDFAYEQSLMSLLKRRLSQCRDLLRGLFTSLNHLAPELVPLHQRLVTLRRLLVSIAAKPRATAAEVANVRKELLDIENSRVDGRFVIPGRPTNETLPGQALLSGLIEDNYELCQDIQAREGAEDVARGPLHPIYERLSDLRAQLERLVLTHRWTLRETDLYNYHVALHDIDNMRVNGKFVDAEGNVPPGQLVLLYLLRRCYGLCYRLMASSEPVSEELMPIANKLSSVKRCLVEVQKFGGPYSQRDLYPYQMALYQIENLTTDGKFLSPDGSAAEGQAILLDMLAECKEIVRSMQEEGIEE